MRLKMKFCTWVLAKTATILADIMFDGDRVKLYRHLIKIEKEVISQQPKVVP